jgi:phosphate/sulfate permease
MGAKMLAADYFKVPISLTLAVVGGVLLIAMALSVAFPAPSKS